VIKVEMPPKELVMQMYRRLISIYFAVALSVAAAACTEFQRNPNLAAPDVVARSAATLERFRNNPEVGEVFTHLRTAAGVVVLPRVIKAGFIGAAEVGTGVVLAKKPDGSWSYPAFYTLGAASIGLQVGVQDTEVVRVVRGRKALEALIEHQGKLGADVGITVGIVGKGLGGGTTADLGKDILVFASSVVGLFGGVSLDGAVLARRPDLNKAYYGSAVTPQAILFQGGASNPAADILRSKLGG
jgi:lipid-binding SYLF domain-containing protein